MQSRDKNLSRRELFHLAGSSVLGVTIARALVRAEARAAEAKPLPPLNRFSHMVQEFFVDRVREIDAGRKKRLESLATKKEAEAYVESVRQAIRESFGPFPERTPLKPRVTSTVERDTYRIENLLFESRPGFLVSANLYVPKGRKFPLPGVVGTCGHSLNGKAAEAYQSFAQGLARQGYVVLIYDPIGQGERLQYPDEKLKSKIGVGVREHLYAGNQQLLVGEFFGTWRAWDGVRALDYLLTREEVDPKQIGVTGNSGGGTMTTWLCGVEQRWTMAAPSCFVTSFMNNLENELPADIEQCPPKAIALGLDHESFLAALAPKPVIILAKEKDFFDVRGTEAAFQRLKHLYRLLGAEENIGLFVGPTYHGYSQENREAMYRWFNHTTGVSDAQTEPPLVIEKDETIQCAPRGQVCELNSRTVFSFTKERSESLKKERRPLQGEELRKRLAKVLRLPKRCADPHYRILHPLGARSYPKRYAVSYAVETEPGIQSLVCRLYDERHYSRPPAGIERAVLYVAHQSSDEEMRSEPLVAELIAAEPDAAFYACDVRGIGESRPDTCGTNMFLNPYGSDYFYAAHSLMLDRPYLGQKTHDVLAVLDWLRSCGHRSVHLVANGWGSIPGTFAAVLSDQVAQVTLKGALTSYSDIAESEFYDWPLSSLLPNVLADFDLPDCYRALKAKQLRIIDQRGPTAT